MADINKNKDKCAGRRDSLKSATPSWLTVEQKTHINKFYDLAKHLSATTGVQHEVDHIIPVNNPIVCGLHVPANLQVITHAQNKEKGNDIRYEAEPGSITIKDIEGLTSIRNRGMFVKGVSGNANGRPKTVKIAKDQQATLNAIFDEADGDAVKFQQLILKNGSKLNLDLSTAMKLAKELSVYQTPRKASIETKNEDVKNYVIQYSIPAKEEPKVIDHEDNDDQQ